MDADGDGYTDDIDCDDGDPAVHPGAAEACDGIDTDCLGGPGPDEVDADGDGSLVCAGDCDDADPGIYPGAQEVLCDGEDNDCAPVTEDDENQDGDPYSVCDGDLDDADGTSFPGAPEICDAVDNDGNGLVDDLCVACDVVVPVDEASIQNAVNVGAVGPTVVCVEPGTYVEAVDMFGYPVHLLGLAGSSGTVIDAGGGGPVITCDLGEGPDTIVEGFTLTGGYAQYGGGIYVESASPTLRSLTVAGNESTGRAGGVLLEDSAAALEDVLVRDNLSGSEGGGIVIRGTSEPTLVNVRVVDNTANGWGGGGLAISGSTSAVLDHLVVAGNQAELGGGLWIESYGNPVLRHVAVVGNQAMDEGGGLYINQGLPLITFQSTIIAHNSSASGGGGVHDGDYSVNYDWSHCALYGNTPVDLAGGVTNPVGQNGNVGLAPDFLDLTAPDAVDWDLHLADTSYLIDLGDPALLDPAGGAGDMGPYGGPQAGGWDLDDDGFFEWWRPGDYDPATSPGLDCDDRDPGIFPGAGC